MRKGLLWFLVSVVASLTGCQTGSTSVVKQPEVNFGRYQVLEIPDLEGIHPDRPWPALPTVPRAVRKEIADTIAEELKVSKLFVEVNRESREPAESVLLLKGRVLKYSPGSRVKRYTDPGSGQASIIVSVKFIETTSGRELAEANFKGALGAGLFGGSGSETHSQIAQEIVQFIRANF